MMDFKYLLKRLTCKVLHHKYYKVRMLSDQSILIGCHRCGNYYGMNNSVRAILPFDEEMCDMYEKHFDQKDLKKYITRDNLFDLITG